jgi:hypothetical protein
MPSGLDPCHLQALAASFPGRAGGHWAHWMQVPEGWPGNPLTTPPIRGVVDVQSALSVLHTLYLLATARGVAGVVTDPSAGQEGWASLEQASSIGSSRSGPPPQKDGVQKPSQPVPVGGSVRCMSQCEYITGGLPSLQSEGQLARLLLEHRKP